MADDELQNELERWGGQQAPAPDPLFVDRLDGALRATSPAGAEPRRSPLLVRPAMIMAFAAAVISAAVLLASPWSNNGVETLVMQQSSNTTVTVPGADPSPAGEGDELPDGTVIDVGPDGFAVVDDIVLPPDSRSVIVDGLLEVTGPEVPAPTAGPTPQPTPTSDRAVIGEPTARVTATPTPTPAPPDDAPVPQPTTIPAPSTPTARAQSPTATAAPTTTPTAEPTGTATPTATTQRPTSTPQPIDAAISLASTNLGPRRALLSWSVTPADAHVAGWQVRVRRGDTVRTAAVIRRGGVRELTVERPQRDRVFYRVVAIGPDAEVLAVSDEVRVNAPRDTG